MATIMIERDKERRNYSLRCTRCEKDIAKLPSEIYRYGFRLGAGEYKFSTVAYWLKNLNIDDESLGRAIDRARRSLYRHVRREHRYVRKPFLLIYTDIRNYSYSLEDKRLDIEYFSSSSRIDLWRIPLIYANSHEKTYYGGQKTINLLIAFSKNYTILVVDGRAFDYSYFFALFVPVVDEDHGVDDVDSYIVDHVSRVLNGINSRLPSYKRASSSSYRYRDTSIYGVVNDFLSSVVKDISSSGEEHGLSEDEVGARIESISIIRRLVIHGIRLV